MKKKIGRLLQVISFVLVLLLCMNYMSGVLSAPVLYEYPARNQFWQNVRAEDDNTIDVVFTGDSTLSNAVVPIHIWEQTQVTSYIIGYSVMKPQESYFDLKKLFENHSPKYVIIEASYLVEEMSENDSLVTSFKDYFDYVDDEITGRIDYFLPVMKYKNAWNTLKLSDVLNKHPYELNNFYKNYFYSGETEPYVLDDSNELSGKIGFKNNGDKYLKKICNLCEKNNCQVLLIALPHIALWNNDYHEKIAELSEKYGITFIDFHTEMDKYIKDFSWQSDTKDGGSHLNYSGATKTTKAISGYLVNGLGMKPTVLTDEQKDKWDNDTKLFYEEISKN